MLLVEEFQKKCKTAKKKKQLAIKLIDFYMCRNERVDDHTLPFFFFPRIIYTLVFKYLQRQLSKAQQIFLIFQYLLLSLLLSVKECCGLTTMYDMHVKFVLRNGFTALVQCTQLNMKLAHNQQSFYST